MPHRIKIPSLVPSIRRGHGRRERKIGGWRPLRGRCRTQPKHFVSNCEREPESRALGRVADAFPKIFLGISFGLTLSALPELLSKGMELPARDTWFAMLAMPVAFSATLFRARGFSRKTANFFAGSRFGNRIRSRLRKIIHEFPHDKSSMPMDAFAQFGCGLMMALTPMVIRITAAAWDAMHAEFVVPEIVAWIPIIVFSVLASAPCAAGFLLALAFLRERRAPFHRPARIVANFVLGMLVSVPLIRFINVAHWDGTMRMLMATIPCFLAASLSTIRANPQSVSVSQ